MTTALRIPEARVIPLAHDLSAQESRQTEHVVRSWTIEQVHSGASSTQLVLSNQRFTDGGMPRAPSWRFNDFEEFRPGRAFRVDMRYVDDSRMADDIAPGDQSTTRGAWYPMIVARVVGLDFDFPQSGGSLLTIRGEDLLSRLKIRPESDIAWGRRGNPDRESTILPSVLERSESGLSAAPVDDSAFSRGYRRLHQRKNQTYLKFLMSRAEDLDWELFLAFDDPKSPDSPAKVHFGPHRSGTLVNESIAELVWARNLLSFQPRFEFWRQFTEVRARGRNPWGGRIQPEETRSGAEDVAAFLHPRGEEGLQTSVQVRQSFDDGPAEHVNEISVQNMDPDRAKAKTLAVLMAKARRFLTARAKTVGNPALRPGIHVRIKQLHAPFDGLYYVEKARHTYDDSGYLTELTLCRPGYLDPSTYGEGG